MKETRLLSLRLFLPAMRMMGTYCMFVSYRISGKQFR